MKSAEEILYTFYTREMSEPYGRVPFDVILKAIREAQREAIKAAAEVANNYSDYANKGVLELLNQIQ